ncbi:MAG TPA: MFS transporter [Thermoanaerobaculia bacterium]|nr:MFS transporter [Thermoanaerobaculia bacterium]
MTTRSAFHGMRSFLILWSGQTVSALGTSLGSFALGVWIYEKTGSATQFAMISFVVGLVYIVANPLGGALADRWDRRLILALSNIGAALMTLITAALLFTKRLEPWHVYPLVALMSGVFTLGGPALLSSISLLVPREQLARASGMIQTSRAAAQIIGPLSAGLLVGHMGYSGLVLCDGLSFLVAMAAILFIRIPRPSASEVKERPSMLASLAFGWKYLRRLPGLFALQGLYGVTNFCMGMVQVLLTPLILSFATPIELGSVNSAGAAGILLGSLALSIWGGTRRRVVAILSLLASQALILFLGGVRPSIPLIALASFTFMVTLPFVNGFTQILLQSKVAAEVQGRVFGVAGVISMASVPLASLIAGPLADRVFEPMLIPGGALADSVGRVIGVGEGRGVGFLFVLLGAMVLVVVGLASLNPRLRRLESEIPDALPERISPEPALQDA